MRCSWYSFFSRRRRRMRDSYGERKKEEKERRDVLGAAGSSHGRRSAEWNAAYLTREGTSTCDTRLISAGAPRMCIRTVHVSVSLRDADCVYHRFRITKDMSYPDFKNDPPRKSKFSRKEQKLLFNFTENNWLTNIGKNNALLEATIKCHFLSILSHKL